MDAGMSSSQPGGDYDLSNPLNSFVEVVGRVVRSHTEFFASIPRRGNLLAPLVFALSSAARHKDKGRHTSAQRSPYVSGAPAGVEEP